MKFKTVFVILLFPLIGFTQNTITLSYKSPKTQETRVYNTLNGIITLSVICKDESAKTKHFLIKREAYVNGENIKTENIISCKVVEYPIIQENDTSYYRLNFCDRIEFLKSKDEQKIVFGAKFENDSIHTIVNYPTISRDNTLKGEKNYIFKPLQEIDSNKTFTIQEGKFYPIIALTPPAKIGDEFASYCLINSQEPKNFYEEYKIKRYYIYYLKVE